jgi:anti-sigma B factor antagonist
MGFQVTSRELERIVVLDATGRLTLDAGTKLRDVVHVLASTGNKKFLLNLAGVDFIDSYGIGELARCYGIVRQAGGEMRLVHVTQKVHAVLQITNLHTLFTIYSEEQTAVREFSRPA